MHVRGKNLKGCSCSLDQLTNEEPMVLLGGFILCRHNSMIRFYLELFTYGGISSSRRSRESLFFIRMVGAGSYLIFNLYSGPRHLQLKLFILNLVSVVVVPQIKPVKLRNGVWM